MSERPHFKWARSHRTRCRCHACRVWRGQLRAARILETMSSREWVCRGAIVSTRIVSGQRTRVIVR